ncbi:MAG TPA: phytanoyl-CoA dioxygenase family protein [Planctomycetota bacterium]|nr:phytanoyl-CoA dioxygenase family protein [Planctomycetota bacterium]
MATAAAVGARAVSADERFLFDLRGYLHLRGALSPGEVADALAWSEEAMRVDLAAFNADRIELMKHHLGRPVSRILDVEPRFLRFLDHPVTAPYLATFCGPDYKHIDNDLFHTVPGYAGGGWHRGVPAHDTGYCHAGRFDCPMVKVFWCLTDVGPGQGPFEVVPGSHKSQLRSLDDQGRLDLPGQHVFDDVVAGDAIIFNEALLHNGRPNTTDRTRKTLIINFGHGAAKCWVGYHPLAATLARCTPRQREILSNQPGDWESPVVPGQPTLGAAGMA